MNEGWVFVKLAINNLYYRSGDPSDLLVRLACVVGSHHPSLLSSPQSHATEEGRGHSLRKE